MDVTDQIVGSGFSSIELRNKADETNKNDDVRSSRTLFPSCSGGLHST
ncbi:hypothetical protein VCRA2117O37_120167 [Vibrio crassostreae]|nr:hypothetical protein VCRA2117O37_120167 [Vibrio crassostreae]CAK1752959.1 hypothetical protein VCRA2116O31_120166 [Vibrio crassostreae]CAK2367675.1 hypothetical protein VCRA2119O51_50001 [Vibrio crassostreae]CAK2544973.1 hypothetical protein VCRA2113O25_120001 [Vibrio crassostreae]